MIKTALVMVCGVCVMCGVGCAEPTAGNSSKATATHSYARARYELERSIHSRLPQTRAAVTRFVHEATSTACDRMMSDAPSNTAKGALGLAARLSSVVVAARANRKAIERFSSDVTRLGWQSVRMTELVRQVAREELAIARITLPALCPIIKAWASGGYSTTPVAITRFLHESRVMAKSYGVQGQSNKGRRLTQCKRYKTVVKGGPKYNVICTAERGNPAGGASIASGETGVREIWRLVESGENGADRLLIKRAIRMEAKATAGLTEMFTWAQRTFTKAWSSG
jgi:hypothetical protein